MTKRSDTVPTRPRKPTAPDTPAAELEGLASQERAHPDCDPLIVQAVVWLFRACNAVVNAETSGLRHAALSPSALHALMALRSSADGTLEPCQLAERLLVSRPSVTGLLHTLQRRGLIARHPHGRDRRRLLVALTPAGHALLEGVLPGHYARQKDLLGGLTPEETATLVTLLRRIRGAQPVLAPDDG